MTVKRAIAAWLSCGAGFALAIAGVPGPTLWVFFGVLGAAYALAPEADE